MRFKHKAPVVEAFVWNGETVDQLPEWITIVGARVELAFEMESDRKGSYKRDVLFYNTNSVEDGYYGERHFIYKGGILINDPIQGVTGTNAAYFYRNYEPAD